MTYVKNIQGLGSKGADSYYDDSLTTPNVCVFDGSTYYVIGDVGNPYNPLAINQPCSFMVLFKSQSGTRVYGTIDNTNATPADDVGEEVWVGGGGNTIRFRRKDDTKTASSYVRNGVNGAANKWNSSAINYGGTGLANDNSIAINGVNSMVIVDNQLLTTTLNNPTQRGYLGVRRPDGVGGSYNGDLAIFSIYKEELTTSQKMEFATDPFGFMARLRAIPAEKAKLYLDIDFNKTGAALPTDEGEGNGGVGFPITLGAGTASYTPFA